MLDTTVKIAAIALNIQLEAVSAEQAVAGQPHTGSATLGEFGGTEIGVWEMTPGAMSDVEANEIFIVLVGTGTVQFEETGLTVPLAPGDVMRLREGQRTIWTITQTLRKVYFA
ncbi:cupin domain-containing protein [Cryobacterium sp. PH29-G1]|uniref:cupin domain-containing protein n=1 Tax=Cryobacterium sp. PH29-G1 TaxID=3046211 RepID=UPI0024BB07A4|nr:cupin domain-containing protein [Cryobacterium sp. PH29-G1]MDJ0348307.1 cupin domain-containing protein [Cryobacterium sp. PH29-G1]